MNPKLRRRLVKAKGPLEGAVIKEVSRVSGGCIHEAWRLKFNDGRNVFAKTGSAEAWGMLNFEAQGLKALGSFANPRWLEIPEPLAIEKFCDSSVLLLPWIDLGEGSQASLGRGLALLHQTSASNHPGYFGWATNGYIGSGPQPGGWRDSWGECFVELRLRPQLKLASQWGLNAPNIESLLSFLSTYLEAYQPTPSIVHGDLWSGNAGVKNDGKGVLIDPASWWADREVDLAMTRLFGGFSNEFYESYEKVWPTSPSASERVDIYNLYHVLNHANLFGGSYKKQCFSILKKLERRLLT